MRTRRTALALLATATLLTGLATPAAAAEPLTRGWPAPIDAAHWQNQDQMTWADYRKVPGTNWADPTLKPSKRTFKGAVVLADYPDQGFTITQPAGSTVFGNPTPQAHDIPRANVARFYQDFLNKPQALNHGHTINEYWMEDSLGRLGVQLTAFGAYRMPGKSYEYGMEFQPSACPPGANCTRDIRTDAHAAWVADVGDAVTKQFDFVFYLSAGQDESSTWQEFGVMKFGTKENVPDAFGPPQHNLPNWAATRYVPWTSWKSAASIWPNAGGGTSVQAESSGMSTYAHEFSHILGIGDNYNNPFAVPPIRDYSGPFEMLSRGTFNGPGGPHTRWFIPATQGASMGSQHMLRNKMKLGIVDPADVLQLDRNKLATSGPVSARITAREAGPLPGTFTGINVKLTGGDKEPRCDQRTNPRCDGGGYDNYTVEVVDRMGTDSFTPDSGVLITKTKNADNAPFEWVIDANPADIGITDYTQPDGTPVKITVGDYRQLNDAMFKAGTEAAGPFEYTDQANRLHFMITDVARDQQGLLSYTVTVASLDGAGAQGRGVSLWPSPPAFSRGGLATCDFGLFNTGSARGAQAPYDSDTYRLTASTGAKGWDVRLPNALATARFGGHDRAVVYAKRSGGGDLAAQVRLTATSVSDPSKTATATCTAFGF